ncbi:MAG: hypothetical protein IKJ26_07380 [Clostridia bacterium]|nr:hypothetical protein [Clostridia bacterium]
MVLKRIRQWLPWIWLACCFFSFCVFLHMNMDNLLDSDMATEMELAKHMIDIGKWFSPDWYYGNEIRVFSIQLFYIPFFFLFDSWHYVRLFGTITAVFCLLASFYYLCRQLKLQRWFPIAASMFLFPLSEIYFYIILLGAMYLPHAIRSFLIIGLLIHFCCTKSRKKAVWLLALVAFISFFSGLGGLRMLLLLFFPVLAAAAIFHFVPGFTHDSVQTRRLLGASGFSVIFAGTGYVINAVLLSKLYTFNQYDSLIFSRFDWSDILLAINYLLEILGFPTDGELFSSAVLHAGLSLILAFILICAVFCAINRKFSMPLGTRLLILTQAFGLLLLTGLISLTNMGLHIRYLIPSLILLPAIAAAILNCIKTHPWLRRVLILFITLLIVVCGIEHYHVYSSRKVNEELKGLSASLVNDGYAEGYSTFWQGSTITELTDGAIEMRVWEPWTNIRDVCSVYNVLQLKSHSTTVPEGKVFIILSKYYNEHEEFDLAAWLQHEETYWNSKNYMVYTFDSYEALLNSVCQQYNKTFKNGELQINPNCSKNVFTFPLYPGIYDITVTGTDVAALSLDMSNATAALNADIVSSSSDTIVFRVQTNELLHDVRISLKNTGDAPCVLDTFHLEEIADI